MISNELKLGTVAVALVSTWTTAHADDFRVTVSPTVNVDNFRLYSERLPSGGIGTSPDTSVLSASFGTLTAGTTAATTLSTSYGTSTAADNSGNYVSLSAVGTTSTAGVVVGGTNGHTSYNFNDAFLGVNMANVRAAIVSGSLSGVMPLYRAGGQFNYNLEGYQQQTSTVTGTLYSFVGSSVYTNIGTYTITPVPEPTTSAAFGLGIAAIVRRRRQAARAG